MHKYRILAPKYKFEDIFGAFFIVSSSSEAIVNWNEHCILMSSDRWNQFNSERILTPKNMTLSKGFKEKIH